MHYFFFSVVTLFVELGDVLKPAVRTGSENDQMM